MDVFNDTSKVFDDFKSKQRSVWSNVFWYVKLCIFWNCIQYTIYWNKRQKVKNIFFGQNKRYKKLLFFFREHKFITVLLLICDSYVSWSTMFVSLELRVGFSILDSILFLLKLIFLFNKKHGFFDFKTSYFLSKLK